jgi:hypothetical protein
VKPNIYEIAEKTQQKHCEGHLSHQFWQNQNEHDKNESGRNIVSITHNVYQTITFIMNQTALLPLLPTGFIST